MKFLVTLFLLVYTLNVQGQRDTIYANDIIVNETYDQKVHGTDSTYTLIYNIGNKAYNLRYGVHTGYVLRDTIIQRYNEESTLESKLEFEVEYLYERFKRLNTELHNVRRRIYLFSEIHKSLYGVELSVE